MVKDPVCGMMVDPKTALSLTKDGKTWYFCSEHCRDAFRSGAGTVEKDEHLHHGETGCCSVGMGHAQHHAAMIADFRRRFFVSLILSIPVVLFSPMFRHLTGVMAGFPGDSYAVLAISTFIFLYGGWPFLKGLRDELAARQPGMMTLIAVAITVAYFYSAAVVFGLPGELFFMELVTLIDVMLLGHWIEMRSVMSASSALEDLARLMPADAHRIAKDGSVSDAPLRALARGDRCLVRPGEKVPADGKVVEGRSEVNESMLTGESRPAAKSAGDSVTGGSLNIAGSLVIEVEKTGEESYVNQVIELVRKASESKSRNQTLADRAAFALTVIALSVGFLTFFVWNALGQRFAFSLERMVTVMIVTCPHALGLAVPLVIAVISAVSARNGLLIRNRSAFETAYRCDTVVFDKTGTLTRGDFGVTDVIPSDGFTRERLLGLAASVELNSEHSIARAVVAGAAAEGIRPQAAGGFSAVPGKGAQGLTGGEAVFVGSPKALGYLAQGRAQTELERLSGQGKTAVLVSAGDRLAGVIGLSDTPKDGSREAVERLSAMGMRVVMITGDNLSVARTVAKELGISEFYAEVLPHLKADRIRQLQAQKRRVAMVGDGVNDAPALAQADLGIAIGAGTDVALDAADVVLVNSDPRDVAAAFSLSRVTQRKMVENLIWATGYNVLAIPLAAGVLYSRGILLPPALGAVLMSLSTVIVAINARILNWQR